MIPEPARILNPLRPRWKEAVAAMAESSSMRAAWETCAARGVIPMAWVGDERRVFQSGPNDFTYANRPHPGTPYGLAAFASDPEGIATAEALAWEAVAALALWGVAKPPALRWRFVDAARLRTLNLFAYGRVASATACAIDAKDHLLRRRWRRAENWLSDPHKRAGVRENLLALLDSSLESAEEWQTCVTHELRVLSGEAMWRVHGGTENQYTSSSTDPPEDLVGRRFAELPDPCAPKVALWGLGYALESIEKDFVTLLCPLPLSLGEKP